MLLISFVIGLLLSSAREQTGACSDFAFKELLRGSPQSRYEYYGRYTTCPISIPLLFRQDLGRMTGVLKLITLALDLLLGSHRKALSLLEENTIVLSSIPLMRLRCKNWCI